MSAGREGEEAFLAAYEPRDHPRPSVTVDVVAFTVLDTDLKVLMVERDNHPFRGCLALPGGFVDVGEGVGVDQGEDLVDAAARELGEEAFGDVEGGDLGRRLLERHRVYLEQLQTFGTPGRDPRTRVISVAHYALVPADLVPLVQAGSDARRVAWMSVAHDLPGRELAFDHGRILDVAVRRIRGKIDYSPIAFNLLPPTFTVTELREVHEAIKGHQYDPGNFRRRFRRMITDGILEQAPGKRHTGGKPAKVYRFVQGERPAEAYVVGSGR